MNRRVSAFYKSRALAEAAAARLSAAGIQDASIFSSDQGRTAESQSGMFDRLASMIAPQGVAGESGFTVSAQVAPERIDAAAIALETGAERVEIAPAPRLAEQVVEISETAEELVLEKQPVVREEIVMRVRSQAEIVDICDTVRRTEAVVERFGPEDEAAQ
jgi:hypothetical protein